MQLHAYYLMCSVLGPFLPSYAEEKFGSTPAEIGMIMAAYPLFNLLTSPCVGIIMNKVGECTKRGGSSNNCRQLHHTSSNATQK
jgi:MFS family permease